MPQKYNKRKEYFKKYYQTNKGKINIRNKDYYETHKEEIKIQHRDYQKDYQKSNSNLLGVPKSYIRGKSRYYLFNTLKHTKLKDYEIHHCFGYENHKCFVYIPRELHLQIHQYLRDNEINAASNHFSQIVHLINACEGYTYIKV